MPVAKERPRSYFQGVGGESKMRFNLKIAAAILVGIFFMPAWCGAGDGGAPAGRWTFDRKQVRSSRVRPAAGKLIGRIFGKASLSSEKPQSLELSGDKSRVLLSEKLDGKALPDSSISVEAWVRVREAR